MILQGRSMNVLGFMLLIVCYLSVDELLNFRDFSDNDEAEQI